MQAASLLDGFSFDLWLEELFRECGFSQIKTRTVKHTFVLPSFDAWDPWGHWGNYYGPMIGFP
jgi:hypothetical protein